jgi:hypothetical protein
MPYQGRIPAKYPDTNYRYTLEPGTVGAPTLSFLNDSNNGLFSPATDNVAITTNGLERFRVDSNGKLILGYTSARSNLSFSGTTISPLYQVESSGSESSISIIRNATNNNSCARIILGKNNSATVGTNTLVDTGEILGEFSFSGNDGTNFIVGSSITAIVDQTPSTNTMPSSLVFSTATSSSTLTEKVRITSAGNVGIGTTNPTEKLQVNGNINLNFGTSSTASSLTWVGSPANTVLKAFGSVPSTGTVIFTSGNPNITTTSEASVYIGSWASPTASGFGNVSVGAQSGYALVGGVQNSFIGYGAGYFMTSGSYNVIIGNYTGNSGGLDIRTNNNNIVLSDGQGNIRYYVNSSGNTGIGTTNPADKLDVNGNILPTIDATYNLGSATKRWANIYSADLQLSNEGSSNDVDGTWGQYTIQEGENDLFLLNRRNGKKYKFVLQEVN